MRNVNYKVLTYKIIFKLLFKMCMSSLSNTGPHLQILFSSLCLGPFLHPPRDTPGLHSLEVTNLGPLEQLFWLPSLATPSSCVARRAQLTLPDFSDFPSCHPTTIWSPAFSSSTLQVCKIII